MSRNMIVRLGVDASDFQKKMAKAGVTAESTGKKISKSLTAEQRGNLEEQLKKAEAAYAAISQAAEGLDLSQPLSKQLRDAEKTMMKFEAQAEKSRRKLRDLRLMPTENMSDSARDRRTGKILSAQADLREYRTLESSARAKYSALSDIAATIGSENIGYASHAGIKALEADIQQLRRTLEETADSADTFSHKASDIGESSQKSGSFISRAAQALRGMAGAGSRLSIIPGFIRRIGEASNNSNAKIEQMVGSIRNMSAINFGFEIAEELLGELSSIINNHISQDAQLQAQVESLSASMGQTLAPAISLVTNVLSSILPYVLGVSNAIGSLMGSLFGSGWSAAAAGANKAAAATSGAAKAQKEMNKQLLSFDQITKLDSPKDDSGGGGGGGAGAVAPLEAKTPAWVERLKKNFTELFESAEFQAANVGGKIGMTLNLAISEAYNALSGVDFTGAGTKLAENFNSAIDSIDWSRAGQLLGLTMIMLPSVLVEFAQTADWALVGTSVSQFLMGSLNTVSNWIRSVDWLQLGQSMKNFVENIDYEGIAQSLGTALGLALGAIGAFLWGMIEEPWNNFIDTWLENTEKAGGDIVAGLLVSLANGVANIATWLWDNFCKPIIDGVKEGFGIHSPSKVFGEIGTNCIDSLTDKFGDGVSKMLQKVEDLKTKVNNAASRLKEAFSFEWSLPHLRLPHLSVQWDPVDNVLAQFFGVTAFPRLSVSWFAKGGILDGAQIFGRMGNTLLGGGERGREAILPLDTNTGWMDVLANRIAASISTDGGGDVNATINLMLDGNLLTSYVLKGIRRNARAGTANI